MLENIRKFLAEVPDSVKGKINGKELIRVSLTSILVFIGAAGVGGIGATLDYIQGNLNTVFPSIVEVGWISGIIAFIFDYLRRKFVHGVPLTPQITKEIIKQEQYKVKILKLDDTNEFCQPGV